MLKHGFADMSPRTLTLGCALLLIGALGAVAAAASPSAPREDLVIRKTHDGLLLKLSKRRGVVVLIVDGKRLGVRRHAPYTFFIRYAALRSKGPRHRIAIRDETSGKLLALRYIRVHLPADCSIDVATMTAPGCTLLREDTAAQADPEPGLWGPIEAVSDSRHAHIATGGDPRPKANGSAQGNTAFRRLTVQDGDDFYGERVELGHNEYRHGENTGTQSSGTFALYREGERKITFFSQRYGAGFTSALSGWQTVMQMKQAQPYAANGPVNGAPAIEIQVFRDRLRLRNFHTTKWTMRAPPNGVWIRYALDAVYSKDQTRGRIKLTMSIPTLPSRSRLQARTVESPALVMQTLATAATAGHGLSVGGPIPSHLRLGIYHNPTVYGTTSVDVDNIQVVRG